MTIWAHPLARAVDSRWTRATVCAMDRCLNGYGSSAGAPAASRAPPGLSLPSRPWHSSTALRPGTRHRTAACFAEPSRWLGHPLWLLDLRCWADTVDVCGPSPAPAPHWRPPPVQPRFGRGRDEGTAQCLGRRGLLGWFSALTMTLVTEPPSVCGADTCGLLLRWKCSQQTLPKPDCTKVKTAEKSSKSAHRERVSLDNWGPHKC